MKGDTMYRSDRQAQKRKEGITFVMSTGSYVTYEGDYIWGWQKFECWYLAPRSLCYATIVSLISTWSSRLSSAIFSFQRLQSNSVVRLGTVIHFETDPFDSYKRMILLPVIFKRTTLFMSGNWDAASTRKTGNGKKRERRLLVTSFDVFHRTQSRIIIITYFWNFRSQPGIFHSRKV